MSLILNTEYFSGAWDAVPPQPSCLGYVEPIEADLAYFLLGKPLEQCQR